MLQPRLSRLLLPFKDIVRTVVNPSVSFLIKPTASLTSKLVLIYHGFEPLTYDIIFAGGEPFAQFTSNTTVDMRCSYLYLSSN